DTSTTEQTNLTTTGIGGEEVDDLDAGNKELLLGGLVGELGSVTVNGVLLGVLNGATLVDGLANHVHDATKSTVADRDHDGAASVNDGLATDETIGGLHGNAADGVVTEVLGDLEHHADLVALDLE